MRSSPKLKPGIWDALVALTVLAMAVGCALAVWSGGSAGTGTPEAVVRMDADGIDTEIRMTLDGLNRVERTVTSNGYTLHIVLTETEAWVESSDCPTQDCVRTAKATHPGQSIVCLPEQVIIKVVGMKTQSDPDLIIG